VPFLRSRLQEKKILKSDVEARAVKYLEDLFDLSPHG
jgi:hypothetical protein